MDASNQPPPLPKAAAPEKVPAGTGPTLAQKAQAAARLAGLAAEKTKLVQVSLPSCYAQLGRACYEQRCNDTVHSTLFKQLDDIAKQIGEASAKASEQSEGGTFADKAKHLGSRGVQFALSQKLTLQRNSLYAQLGKAAYEAPGGTPPSAVHDQIAQLRARITLIDAEVRQISEEMGSSGLTPKRMIAGVIVALALVGILFVGRFTGSGSSAKSYKAEHEAETAAKDEACGRMSREADDLWDSGKKPEALDKYATLLDEFCGDGKGGVWRNHKPALARAAVRAIDELVGSGNTEAAKRLIKLADEISLTLVFRNPDSNKLVPKARAEQKQQEEEDDREFEAMRRRTASRDSTTTSDDNDTDAAETVDDGPSSGGRQAVTMLSRVKKKMTKDTVRRVCGRNPTEQMAIGKGEMWLFQFNDGSTLHVTFDKFGEMISASDVTDSK